jgi:crotonobetainyl-CoA:carnitine CoA-transferase CaiB-like acyl-CoA transferase
MDSTNAATSNAAGPLAGVRVLDLTQIAAGPWVGVLLGWLGATVIRIEPPGDGDWGADFSTRVPPTMNGLGTTWLSCNLFKQSVALNFKDEKDRAIGHRIAAGCDLVVENLRRGVNERLGFGYEELKALNPKICYVSINGYGQVGPMADERATDPLIQAFSGWGALNGAEGGEMHRSFAHLDLTSGTYAAFAAMLLLYRQRATGQGGRLNLPMYRAALNNQTTRLAEYFATGKQPPNLASASARYAPDQAFRCADNRFLAVSALNEEQWVALCTAVSQPDLTQRFGDNADRVARRDELAEALTPVFATKPSRWWQLRLTAAGVPNGPFLGFDELLNHPQTRANWLLVQDQTPLGPVWVGGNPFRFEGRPDREAHSSLPNADTAAVLAELKTARPERVGV